MTIALKELPDRELVLRCRQDETEPFNELVIRHQDRIYTAITRFCGNAEDACDITQRTFLNAFRKIREFKGDCAFSTWIYRIAFNQAISFRRENRRTTAKDEERIAEPVDERSPTEKMESEETGKKVQQALELLDEGDRRIILLKDLQGHSYDEIAEILQISKGTVRSQLHRARLDLKAKLKSFVGTLK
jgi:RNA polymerase sigma-70 factor (ECF subfamily)